MFVREIIKVYIKIEKDVKLLLNFEFHPSMSFGK